MAQWVNELIRGLGLWGVPILVVAAMLEYVFPPFPGDTVTVFAAWMAVMGELHWAWVWTAVTGGSAVGMALDWFIGRWLSFRSGRLPHEGERPWYNPLSQERLERFQRRYQRWGDWLILLNRFVPALRAVFFLAAGASGLPLFRVMVLGLVSAGVWNALLLFAGYQVGENLEELERLVERYTTTAWIVIGAVVVVVVAITLLRKWRTHRRR